MKPAANDYQVLLARRVVTDAEWIATDLAAVLNRAHDLGISVAADPDYDCGGDFVISWNLGGVVKSFTVTWDRRRETWVVES